MSAFLRTSVQNEEKIKKYFEILFSSVLLSVNDSAVQLFDDISSTASITPIIAVSSAWVASANQMQG